MSNGLVSFDAEFVGYYPQPFPRQDMVVAPLWDDNDLSHKGVVLYTLVTPIHPTLSGLITEVNDYISNSESTRFRAQWILVARWVDVCPFGNNECNNVRHSYAKNITKLFYLGKYFSSSNSY